MASDKTLADIQAVFDGAVPIVFRRMQASGDLERYWPGIRAVLVEPEPLPPPVVHALISVLSLRCSSHYCFVLHALTLRKQGASQVAIRELARMFEMPEIVPEHERWSRVLKLTWLSQIAGPQQRAADHVLRRICSEAEYEQILRVHAANRILNSFTEAPELGLDGEPMLETFPEELRALVPEFVHFYMQSNDRSAQQRPVSVMCSVCRDVRAVDEQWYPFAAARELLAADVLFSHGLCPTCFEAQGVPFEPC